MKKLLIAVIFVFTSSLIHAQNWELFHLDSTYNFEAQITSQSDILGVKVDSMKFHSSQSTYFFNRILNDTIYQNAFGPNIPITDITQPNIFGEQAISRNDTIILTNQFGSKLYLKPKAPINASWVLINMGSKIIHASIDSIFQNSINGVLDSLKRIVFQCYDSTASPKSHRVNQMELVISKAHGIIKSPNFYEDIEDNSINYNYKKNFTRVFKSTYYSRAAQLELNVGDEYHTRKELNPQGPPDTEYTNYKVLSKTTSANGDTINMTLEVKRKHSTLTVDNTTNPPTSNWSHSFSTSTKTKTIVNANQIVDTFPAMHVSVANDTFGIKRATSNLHSLQMGFVGGPYNNRLVYKPNEFEAFYDTSYNSWLMNVYATYNVSYYFLKGITELEFITVPLSSGGVTYVITYLEYFKKGNETYGSPQIVTGIDDNQIVKREPWFYPNPAVKKIQINPSLALRELRIYNFNGQLVHSIRQPKGAINISQLSRGLYFIEAITVKGNRNKEKLLIQQ